MQAAPSSAWSASLAREWARLRADPWDLAMLGWIPLALYFLTWAIFSAGIARNLPLVVRDLDHSAMSRGLVRMLDESPGLAVMRADSDAEALHAIRAGRAYGIVSIPMDMQARLLRGERVTLQWAYNAQFPSHAGSMTRDVRAVVATLSAGAELKARIGRGAGPAQAREQLESVAIRLAPLFNDSGSILPSLALPVEWSLLHMFVTLSAVTAIGRELRAATVPAWLATANGRLGVAVLSKLAIPFGVFLLHAVLLTVAFGAVLGWPILGSAVAMALGTVLFIMAYLAMGLCIVAWSGSLRMALSACAFITAPAFAYSGQGFPLLAMPGIARAWAEALPLSHFLSLVNRTWLGGAPLRYSAAALAALALLMAGFGLAGYLRLAARTRQPASWGKS
jgi:ABC-2 type transport system permease protein